MSNVQLAAVMNQTSDPDERHGLRCALIGRLEALQALKRVARRVSKGSVSADDVREALRPFLQQTRATYRSENVEVLRELTKGRPDVVLPPSIPTLKDAFSHVVRLKISSDLAARAFQMPRARASSYISIQRRRAREA